MTWRTSGPDDRRGRRPPGVAAVSGVLAQGIREGRHARRSGPGTERADRRRADGRGRDDRAAGRPSAPLAAQSGVGFAQRVFRDAAARGVARRPRRRTCLQAVPRAGQHARTPGHRRSGDLCRRHHATPNGCHASRIGAARPWPWPCSRAGSTSWNARGWAVSLTRRKPAPSSRASAHSPCRTTASTCGGAHEWLVSRFLPAVERDRPAPTAGTAGRRSPRVAGAGGVRRTRVNAAGFARTSVSRSKDCRTAWTRLPPSSRGCAPSGASRRPCPWTQS